jgi:hypothetical protein
MGAWPILGLSAHSPDIEAAAMPATNGHLADYGLAIARFGNLDVNLDDDDNARLKKLAGDTAYSRLAAAGRADLEGPNGRDVPSLRVPQGRLLVQLGQMAGQDGVAAPAGPGRVAVQSVFERPEGTGTVRRDSGSSTRHW